MKERDYQAKLIKELKRVFPGCDVMKNDANYRQGYPDLTVRIGLHCFMLEVKASATSKHQPNQDYYVDDINQSGGFARFIYPENEEEVIRAIQRSLRDQGVSLVTQS